MGCSQPIEAIALFEKMMVEMNLENPVAGDRDAELTALSTSVNLIRLKNNPVELDGKTIFSIYEQILIA